MGDRGSGVIGSCSRANMADESKDETCDQTGETTEQASDLSYIFVFCGLLNVLFGRYCCNRHLPSWQVHSRRIY